jgi:uncharacterized protein YbaR (Trm112 family)
MNDLGLLPWIVLGVLWALLLLSKQYRIRNTLIKNTLAGSDSEPRPASTRISCQHCAAVLELSEHEWREGKFVCPKCLRANDIGTLAEDDEEELDSPTMFRLKAYAVCPKCHAELELESQERINGEFVCPECRRRSAIEEDAPIRQYWLPKNPVCPECSHENGLADMERDQPSFVCAGCRETIVFVEQ